MADWKSTDDIRTLPALGEAADPAFWADYGVGAEYVARWHSVATSLGIEAFGVNACTGSAGEVVMVDHEEASFGGQDELYVVLEGRARFTVDGEERDLGAGGAIHCRARVQRVAVALETPTTVLAIGAFPDRAYGADTP